MKRGWWLAALLLTASCAFDMADESDPEIAQTEAELRGGPIVAAPDEDGDDYPAGLDCDDHNCHANPGHLELCDDGVDNDCDGQIDETPCARGDGVCLYCNTYFGD
jgi:hypothetical protein